MNYFVIKTNKIATVVAIDNTPHTPWINWNSYWYCRVISEVAPTGATVVAEGNDPYELDANNVVGVFA